MNPRRMTSSPPIRRLKASLRLLTALAGLALWSGLSASVEPPPSESILTARDVVVVANSSFPGSLDLAHHYLKARGIPQSQLLVTAMPRTETIDRQIYERQIANPLKDFLVEEGLGHIRCVVLMYGVPLRASEPRQTAQDKRMEAMVRQDREAWQDELLAAIKQARQFAPDPSADPPAQTPAFDGKDSLSKQVGKLGGVFGDDMRRAAGRIATLPEGPKRAETEAAWLRLWQRQYGFTSPADRGLKTPGMPPMPQVPAERKTGYARRLIALLQMPPSVQSIREFNDLSLESRGTTGALALSDKMLKRVRHDWQSRASVDSELCTLFWPDLPLARWVRNPLNNASRPANAPRTLMVCRLDGPSEAIVRRMIDDAVAVEAEGLQGRVYLDSRGFNTASSAYGRYDMDLQTLARTLDEQTSLSVTLDMTGDLFQPGDCPEAALYCGWYKLGHYVDAFEFQRGAIGFHMASNEAMRLHDPDARLWCPSLLADGVVATLGPVEEPYLTAFPLPSRFFGLLLQGRLTLAECYFQTVPSLSWMMTLIGDPLYRPYAAHPAIKPTPTGLP